MQLQDLSDKIGIEVKYTSYTEKAEDVLWYDKDSEKSYHKGRIAFAELPNGEVVVLTNDTRSHIEWFSEDYNITKEEFNSLCRGYIDESNVIMYKGVEFSAIDDTDRVLKIANELCDLSFGKNIYDGVIRGRVGEKWRGKQLVKAKFTTVKLKCDLDLNNITRK